MTSMRPIAIGWPHHKRHYHQRHLCFQSTPSNAYVQTTSSTKVVKSQGWTHQRPTIHVRAYRPADRTHTTRQFLHTWGPPELRGIPTQSGVKTIKRLITGNVGKDGAITHSSRPSVQEHTRPRIFGRPMKDLIPILPGYLEGYATWRDTLNYTI